MDSGTRLGHNNPKGTFKIEFEKGPKSLFEITTDTLKRANEKYKVIIPWYIMTSKENSKQTVEFLEENNYFGYPKEYIEIFMQEEIPYLSEEGNLVIDDNMHIKEAANGNGGIFESMSKNGILENMRKKNIEWIFIGSIDNILLELADTFLIGASIKNNTKIGTKTILKNAPKEKVGVFCKRNGKIKVIEYLEISKELANRREENGELTFGEAHIMCNLFHITALEKASTKELKYHIINKGNCYKFEKFIFDAFGLFEDITIVRGTREKDFAPVKNLKGEDSIDTAKNLYEKYFTNVY